MVNFAIDYNVPVYSSINFSEVAQEKLIIDVLRDDYFKCSPLQRQLASYPCAYEDEKDKIVLFTMDHFWGKDGSFEVMRDFDRLYSILGTKGHFIHQFEVFLLGFFIIQKILQTDNGSTLINKFGVKNLYDSWMIASTAHDIGYPLQLQNKLAVKLAEMYRKLNFKNLSKRYRDITSDIKIIDEKNLLFARIFNSESGLNEKVYIPELLFNCVKHSLDNSDFNINDFFNEKLNSAKPDHALVSALVIYKLHLEYLSRLNKGGGSVSDELDYFTSAVAAIAIHSVKDEGFVNKICFEKNPIAFLLFLVDNIQEWNRSLAPHKTFASYNLIDFNFCDNKLSLKYLLTHESWGRATQTAARDSLNEKETLLYSLASPKPALGLDLEMEFLASKSAISFDKIQISI